MRLAASLRSRLQDRMQEEGVEVLAVADGHNLTYLTGVHDIGGVMVLQQDDWQLYTSKFFRYSLKTLPNVSIYAEKEELQGLLERSVLADGCLADNPDRFSSFDLEESSLVADARRVKTAEEVQRMREACRVGDEAFAAGLDVFSPGVSEMQVVRAVDAAFRAHGVVNAFDTLVHAGTLEPHRLSDTRTIKEGELVLCDLGCRWKRYCSDMTRMLPNAAGGERRDVVEAVKAIQGECVGLIEPGVAVADVAQHARDRVEELGFSVDEHYLHTLGHGVGVEVHEPPLLHVGSDAVFAEGMVVTVEPGLYVPGAGGARIEDQVVVTENGVERLTGAKKVGER